jgi:hypothetical protein
MHANTRHSGLRPKRCLPAKFHQTRPPRLYLKNIGTTSPAESLFKYPQVAATIVTALKCAQLTLFYGLLPNVCRIGAVDRPNSDAAQEIINKATASGPAEFII